MRKTVVRMIRAQARQNAKDGSVIISQEHRRLKKLYVNPHYSKNTNNDGSNPGEIFSGPSVLIRKLNGKKAGIQNHLRAS